MINKQINFILAGFFFLFPIFYLTSTADFYEYNKLALLTVTTTILFFLFGLKIVQEKKITLHHSAFSRELLLLAGIALISFLFQSQNIVVSATTPLSVTTIIFGVLLYFMIANITDFSYVSAFKILTIDALIIATYTFLLYLDFIPKSLFTPAGTLLSSLIFLIIISAYLSFSLWQTIFIKKDQPENPIFNTISLIIITLAALILGFHLFTDQKPIILPLNFGWIITLEVLKNLKTILLGVGPANFITAFTLTKPVSINATPFWNIVFTSSSSFLLNLVSEMGIFTGIIYIWILVKTTKKFLAQQKALLFALLVALLVQLFLPTGMTVFILTIILLAFSSPKEKKLELNLSFLGFLNYLFILPGAVLLVALFYFGGRAYLSEAEYKQSLDALLNNQGTSAYNHQVAAMKYNPFIDRYHIAFSQTNLYLADALASKKDQTDDDKQKIPHFVQQAIDHARNAVVLYRTNVFNWENLAKTYSSLLTYAQGADEWAIQTYRQKILLDPMSPNNYLALGNVLMRLKRASEAEVQFKQAIKLKQDLGNAHYNLSLALSDQNKYEEAYQELSLTLSLLTSQSDAANKIQNEMKELEKLLPVKEATTSAIPAAEGSQNLDISQPRELLPNAPTISLEQPPTQ